MEFLKGAVSEGNTENCSHSTLDHLGIEDVNRILRGEDAVQAEPVRYSYDGAHIAGISYGIQGQVQAALVKCCRMFFIPPPADEGKRFRRTAQMTDTLHRLGTDFRPAVYLLDLPTAT